MRCEGQIARLWPRCLSYANEKCSGVENVRPPEHRVTKKPLPVGKKQETSACLSFLY